MDFEKLKQAIEVAKLLDGECTSKAAKGDGRPVIVRSRDAGVLFGNYAGHEPNGTVYLKNARQLWRWHAAKGGTLADVAEYGVNEKNCKFSVAKATVTIFGACAIIDCSAAAASSIEKTEGQSWK